MAKKIVGYIKLQIPAGKANPSPPVGPALGQRGLNIMAFVKEFNAATQTMEPGMPVPVVITAFADRSFTFITKTPPNTYFLKKAAEHREGQPRPPARARPVGRVTTAQLREIAAQKMKDMNANDVEGAVRMLAGSARSMGLDRGGGLSRWPRPSACRRPTRPSTAPQVLSAGRGDQADQGQSRRPSSTRRSRCR